MMVMLDERTLRQRRAIHDGPDAVPMYGHSIIFRCRSKYFAAMFNDDNQRKEKTKGVIHNPNISPAGFYALLYYIYTGSIVAVKRHAFWVAHSRLFPEFPSFPAPQSISYGF